MLANIIHRKAAIPGQFKIEFDSIQPAAIAVWLYHSFRPALHPLCSSPMGVFVVVTCAGH